MDTSAKNQVSIKQLISDLSSGMTRYKKDDFGNGSIEEKYNLTQAQVARIFKHDKLKGLKVKGKTRIKDEFELIDDVVMEEAVIESELTSVEVDMTEEVDVN